jgi:GNAT superfamily N-acetyltransferase
VTATIRPLREADIEAARTVQVAAMSPAEAAEHSSTDAPTQAAVARQRRRIAHFLAHDPGGSWVAELDGAVVGVALALRRDRLWGLSLLAVLPAMQSQGIGRQLLDASLRYADGVELAVILSSDDPRAMRRYAVAGFDLFPQVSARGELRRDRLRAAGGRVRDGRASDVAMADAVDGDVRGAPRGPDHDLLSTTWQFFVVDDVDGRGYAYLRPDGEIETIAASDEDTATALLWRCLGAVSDAGAEASIWHVNGGQQWAVRVVVDAGLVLRPSGPVYWRGATPPPCYLPTGAFL